MGRAPSPAAVDVGVAVGFEIRTAKHRIKFKGGGQECPPHTVRLSEPIPSADSSSSGTSLPLHLLTPRSARWFRFPSRRRHTGRVLSKTLALVKLRMEKLSSHLSGQGRRRPFSSYSTRILRANIEAI